MAALSLLYVRPAASIHSELDNTQSYHSWIHGGLYTFLFLHVRLLVLCTISKAINVSLTEKAIKDSMENHGSFEGVQYLKINWTSHIYVMARPTQSHNIMKYIDDEANF